MLITLTYFSYCCLKFITTTISYWWNRNDECDGRRRKRSISAVRDQCEPIVKRRAVDRQPPVKSEIMDELSHGYLKSPLPFLVQPDVTVHLRKSKVMFLMRGLPGSGKSSISKAICEKYRDAVICSADDGFLQEDGTYRFDRELLEKNHNDCQEKAKNACKEGKTVVIDNTNVKKWEMEPYRKMALHYEYLLIPVTPTTEWAFDPVELSRRNKHRVDEETIRFKLRDFISTHPSFYAWFSNDSDSTRLKSLASSYFSECTKRIPGFISSLGHGEESGSSFADLYTKGGILHCTAFFVGSGPLSDAAKAYMSKFAVKNSVCQIFTLRIIGLLITPRTVGARVEIAQQELPLWNNDQDQDQNPQKMQQFLKGVRSSETPFLGNKVCGSYNFAPMQGRPAQKAHITLGTAEGIAPVQTGPDLLRLVALESTYRDDGRYFKLDCTKLEGKGFRARFYGPDDGFVIYFDKVVEVPSIFSYRY